MTPELGHFALILALLVALVQGVLPILGAHRGQAAWIAIARPAAQNLPRLEAPFVDPSAPDEPLRETQPERARPARA